MAHPHGDTLDAASLGGVGRFFERFAGWGYRVTHVRSIDELCALDPKYIAGLIIEYLENNAEPGMTRTKGSG